MMLSCKLYTEHCLNIHCLEYCRSLWNATLLFHDTKLIFYYTGLLYTSDLSKLACQRVCTF